MVQKYKAVLTTTGAAKIAAATAGGAKVNLKQMAVGDGGGTLPMPDPAQTKLIAEKHRAVLNKVIVDPKHKNYLVAELVIPPETGGFWMRELGLYDDTGALIAVSNMAESYKPLLSEGSGRAQTLRMVVIVSDMDSVNLQIDASTVLATQEYVDDKLLEHEQSRRHPDATLKDKGFTQLSSATNSDSEVLASTPKAVKVAYDLANAKYTAQDATTARKGIVQLSSATDSTSEMLASTPKAVKAAYDMGKTANDNAQTADSNAGKANENANTRLEKSKNLSDLTNKAEARKSLELGSAATSSVQTSPTDNSPNAVLKVGAFGLDGNSIPITTTSNSDLSKMPGIPFNGIREYKSSDGSVYLIGISGISPSGNLVEWLAPENGPEGKKIAVRNKDSLFTLYSTGNKPTANDVGALPLAGGTMAGAIKVSGIGRGAFSSQNSNEAPIFQYIDTAGTSEYWPLIKQKYKQANATWSAGTLVNANRFIVHYQDAAGSGALFSFYKDGQFVPANYANFDVKYQAKGNYTPAGQAYTKAESDVRFQPKGSYTPAGQAYTKAESDTRYAKAVPFAGAGGVGTYTLVATNTTQTVTFGKPMQGAKLAMLDANQRYYAGSALAGTWIWLGHTIGIGGTWFYGMAYRSA
ncbi:phage tail protein [Obesumbacterium proteus]|uniref:Phage tail fiber protein n=1 Tax=Obesumbacterium proteus ATCC 12841 TaxID=1354268 RepID=A0AA91EHL5_9GAMM|nr:phage tail protein [Obesumbacterium proteus]OAT60944.1 phage tail fiber protein [Obesumbacterium proteus ATCC 12841]